MYIVILAGGSGTRFWPLSRARRPKQLMSILGGKSMLQRTVERVLPLSPDRVMVVTNAMQAAETALQLHPYMADVPIDIIEEPVGRNTAPAIGLAAAVIRRHQADGLMVVLPADHYITDEDEFRRTVRRGVSSAMSGRLLTMGIVPTRPETGYGYIEADAVPGGTEPYPVKRFVEKPDMAKALEFLEAGSFYWNSGMFIWRADEILLRMKEHMPSLSSALEGMNLSGDKWELSGLKQQVQDIYQNIPGESIDYGIMEKAAGVVMLPCSFGWSDVGSWDALPEVAPDVGAGNVVINAGEFMNIESSGCIVYGGEKLVALLGVDDVVVVNTADALMLCRKGRTQEIRKIVQELKNRGLEEFL